MVRFEDSMQGVGPSSGARGEGKAMEPLEIEHPGRERKQRRGCRRLLWGGLVLSILGCLLIITAVVIAKKGNDYRASVIRRTLVVDSDKHPEYRKWLASSTASKTAMLHSYSFFNLTNAEAFLAGQPPVMQEVGPFTFKEDNKKYNVRFSDDGRLVTYTTLYQYQYQGDRESDMDQLIYTVNMPYTGAVNTVGGEDNMLTAGAQQAIPRVRDEMTEYFVPAMKENAVVQAIKKSLEGVEPINVFSSGAVTKLWGGNCIAGPLGLFRFCGFELFESIAKAFQLAPKLDLALMKLSLDTRLTKMPLNQGQVAALWDETNEWSLMNTDRYNASIRYGIARWVGENVTEHAEIKKHFVLSDAQFSALHRYVQAIHDASQLEQRAVKQFMDSIPAADRKSAQISKWDDFVMRQFLVGDVIGRLKADDNGPVKFESVQPDNPPEFGFFAESVGVKTFDYEGSHRLNLTQGQCLFGIGNLPQAAFQANFSGLPPPRINRRQFVDEGLNASMSPDLFASCFKADKDRELLQGYFKYLGKNFVADEFNKTVLQDNGGLITHRSIRELIKGHVAPILKLSLAPDDPRAMNFGLMVNDPSLNGPARCLSAADVGQPYTACVLSGTHNGTDDKGNSVVLRTFDKVPHTYHTGKDDDSRLGAWNAYHGDTYIREIWPGGNFALEGALEGQKSSVQFGYSDGTQFPPFNAVAREGARISVFVPNFVLPLHFNFQKDVEARGIKLKRFVLSEETFSSSRPDAHVFDMDQVKQKGLFNLTGVVSALAYLTRPHYRPTAPYDMADVKGLRAFNAEEDESYLDVEPVTGKAMAARIQLQLVAGLDNGAFGNFHKTVYPAKALPIMYIKQHAQVSSDDAAFFKKNIYGSEKALTAGAATSGAAGGLALLIGAVLLVLHFARGAKKRKDEEEKAPVREEDGDEEAKVVYENV